ncbi:modulator of levamisole receptor-1 domain-containing protein [Ditylenchus destructor]|uniref:Modulator of levamisole receptor-1 domain-containing protein n=1 Tax=Ditylenchus destructor TaxID=166010 RepID=A0AAD4MZM1_9BILA|nr:modulator of levamisole receptor-1 domain-containing protein [Ditylenchus destructor]
MGAGPLARPPPLPIMCDLVGTGTEFDVVHGLRPQLILFYLNRIEAEIGSNMTNLGGISTRGLAHRQFWNLNRISALLVLWIAIMFQVGSFEVVMVKSDNIWSVYRIPNPRQNNTECNTPVPSFLCDPEEVFTEAERLLLHYRLDLFEHETANPKVNDVCKQKGMRLGLAVTRNQLNNPIDVNPPTSVIQFISNKWRLDDECDKWLIFMYVNHTNKITFWEGPANTVALTDIYLAIGQEEKLLKQGKVLEGFMNILDNLQVLTNRRMKNMWNKSSRYTTLDGDFKFLPVDFYTALTMFSIALLTSMVVLGVGLLLQYCWKSHFGKKRDSDYLEAYRKNTNCVIESTSTACSTNEQVYNPTHMHRG